MLKGIEKADKKLYKFEEKSEGFYKVTDKATNKNRTMTISKVKSIFGNIKLKETKEIKEDTQDNGVDIDIIEVINNIDLDTFKSDQLSKEEKSLINEKVDELKIVAVSYKDKIVKLLDKLEEEDDK